MNKTNLIYLYKKNPDFIIQYGGLIDKNKLLNTKDTDNNTLLHLVIINNDLPALDALLDIIEVFPKEEREQYLNIQNVDLDTSLHLAVRNLGNLKELIDKMIKLGANTNLKNKQFEVVVSTEDIQDTEDKQDRQDIQDTEDRQSENSIFDFINPPINTIYDSAQNRDPRANFDLLNELPTSTEQSKLQTDIFSKYNSSSISSFNTESPVFTKYSQPIQTVSRKSISSNQPSFEEIISSFNNAMTSDSDDVIINNNNLIDSSSANTLKYNDIATDIENLTDIEKLPKGIYLLKLEGGDKKYIKGSRTLTTYFESETESSYNKYQDGGSKESSKIHDEVIDAIKNLGYNEQDAKDIKNLLYHEIKEKYPNLGNVDRANKMKDKLEKTDVIKKLDMEIVRKELAKFRLANPKQKITTETEPKVKKSIKKEKKISKKTSRVHKSSRVRK